MRQTLEKIIRKSRRIFRRIDIDPEFEHLSAYDPNYLRILHNMTWGNEAAF